LGSSYGDEHDWALRTWLNQDRVSLQTSSDPKGQQVIEAARQGIRVKIVYYGGSEPGSTRWIRPTEVYRVEGYGMYVAAFCELRGESRTFRLSRLVLTDSRVDGVPSGPTRRQFGPSVATSTAPTSTGRQGCMVMLVGTILVVVIALLACGGW